MATAEHDDVGIDFRCPDGAHKYGKLDDLTPDKDGLMHAPTEPGIGGQIDFELIKRKTEALLTLSLPSSGFNGAQGE